MDPEQSKLVLLDGKVQLLRKGDQIRLQLSKNSIDLSPEQARQVATSLIEMAAIVDDLEHTLESWARISMQYLYFEVEGKETEESDPEHLKQGGAHCWIRDQNKTDAIYIATGWIEDSGWIITDLIEHSPASRDDFEGTEWLRYYEQALIDNEVFVFEIDADSE